MSDPKEHSNSNKIGFIGATSYVVGNIIGSGIFISPITILKQANSVGLSLIIWVICGVIAVLGSLCYTELGTSIRQSGCDFAYQTYVGWHAVAFTFMWVTVIMSYPAALAIQAQTFGQYVVNGIGPVFCIEDKHRTYLQIALGLIIVWVLTFLNFFSLAKFAARLNIVAAFAKLLSTLIIIVTGFYLLIFKGWTGNFDDALAGSSWKPGSLVLGIYGGLFAYAGWEILNQGIEDVINPQRTMPLALLVGLSIVTIVYLLTNTAYFVVLSVDDMKHADAVAVAFSSKVLGKFQYVVPFLVCVVMVGSLNASIFVGSRLMFAAARQKRFPFMFSCYNELNDSPRSAVLAQSLIGMILCFVGDVSQLLNYYQFSFYMQFCFSLLALLWIRYKKLPVHKGALHLPIPLIIIVLLISIALVLVPMIQDFAVSAVGLGIVASGLVLYFVFLFPTKLPRPIAWLNDKALSEATTKCTSILLNALPNLRDEMSLDVQNENGSGIELSNGREKNGSVQDDKSSLGQKKRF